MLDAACGYGRLSPIFEKYIGVDFSPDFINIARKSFPKKEFLVANIKELPFEDNKFDWSICSSLKTMIEENSGEEEWNKMKKELLRVSKKILILEYTEAANKKDYSGHVIEK